MLFNSSAFIVFICAVVLVYYLAPCVIKQQGIQSWILVFSGLFFYGYNSPYCMASLIICCLFNEAVLSVMEAMAKMKSKAGMKAVMVFGVAVNVAALVFFKYGGLFAKTILGENHHIASYLLGLPIPLGISFYIFHAISMTVDSGKKGTDLEYSETAVKRLVKVLCYMSFFPNSVSGPIIRYDNFSSQIKRHYFKEVDKIKVFEYLLLGYFFKTVVADNIQNYTIILAERQFMGTSPIRILVGMFGYSCQIFADFAGYSYIAIGLGLLLGFKLPQNFNFPYISKSVKEFWRRWHMSLSAWLKTYIYIPLGGNRKGVIRTYLNLMIVMLIGGIWHGGAWKYLLWGALHGLLLVIERILSGLFNKKDNEKTNPVMGIIKILITFTIVSWLWLFFKMDSHTAVLNATKQVFTGWEDIWAFNTSEAVMACFYMLPVFGFHGVYVLKEKGVLKGNNWKYIFYAVMIIGILLNRGTSDAFIYFDY